MNNLIFNSDGKLNMDFPLIRFSDDKLDWWRIRDAFEGVQIFGGIGSGKTSGSGKMIATSFLKNGFGGLVMCAKKGEAVEWLDYAFSTNRFEDIVVMGKKNKYEIWAEYLEKKAKKSKGQVDYQRLEDFKNRYSWQSGNDKRFNPLQYEMTREGEGAGEVFNLSNLFMELYNLGNRFSGGGGSGGDDRYWDTALKRCMNRMFQLLILADKEVSVENMRKILETAPSEDEVELYYETVEKIHGMSDEDYNKFNEEFAPQNFCIHCLIEAGYNDEEVDYEFELVSNYFLRQFAKLDEKTRSIVTESFLGIAEPFLSGILKTYFSEGINLKPEITFEGKIIILDFSVKEYLQAGVYAQGIFKLLWQQAIERRDTDIYPLPAFLWVDESQYFVNEYDTIFQTTARSSRACTVFLTQNISNYYSQMGGDKAKSKVDSLLGNLSTKIFHANNDAVTNEWASNVIGKDLMPLVSKSEQKKRLSMFADTTGKNQSLSLLPQVLPHEFTTLSSGGKFYDFTVQAIIQIKGRRWSDGSNFKMVNFSQV